MRVRQLDYLTVRLLIVISPLTRLPKPGALRIAGPGTVSSLGNDSSSARGDGGTR